MIESYVVYHISMAINLKTKEINWLIGKKSLLYINNQLEKNSVALVREGTIPTERPPPVGEISANFCG